MKNISYLLSLLLAFSYVSFADEKVKEASLTFSSAKET